LIIEDEPVAARNLQRLIVELAPEIQALGPLPSVRESVEWLQSNPPPDLLFLDVQLTDGLSFEIFDSVAASVPVIFTTAFDDYALRAFESFGIDYLLKPIDPARFARAMAKFRQLTAADAPPLREVARHYRDASGYRKQRFLVQSGDALQSIEAGHVAYFVKELVVRLVTTEGRGYALSQSLDEIEPVVDPALFFRINRQVLAHIQAVKRVHKLFKGKLQVELSPPSAQEVVVSQERAAPFRAWLDR
jgi:two-component system LytT family response regulator